MSPWPTRGAQPICSTTACGCSTRSAGGAPLNQALMYGFDAAGVERDGRAVDAYEVFLKTWLRDKRIKHKATRGKIRRDGRVAGRRFDITLGADSQRVTVVDDDTVNV